VLKIIRQNEVAKLQWLWNPSETNGDNLNSVRHETSRTFREKGRECLKEKLNGLKEQKCQTYTEA
jgi:hypothetical protein